MATARMGIQTTEYPVSLSPAQPLAKKKPKTRNAAVVSQSQSSPSAKLAYDLGRYAGQIKIAQSPKMDQALAEARKRMEKLPGYMGTQGKKNLETGLATAGISNLPNPRHRAVGRFISRTAPQRANIQKRMKEEDARSMTDSMTRNWMQQQMQRSLKAQQQPHPKPKMPWE